MKNQYGSNFKVILFWFLILFHCPLAYGQIGEKGSDSTKKNPRYSLKSTARFHSKGMFSYAGRISSSHSAFDINLIYERKQWGFLFFKAFDLEDLTSPNNFSLAVLYRNFNLTDRLTVTPHVGAFLEQPHSFAGHGSDAVCIIITAFKVNQHLTLDHATLVGNLIVFPDLMDWVNRVRLLYTIGHIDITGAVWHNNHAFDLLDYTSCALILAVNRLKLSEAFNLGISVTDIALVQTSNSESLPRKNSVVFTLAIQFTR